MMGGEGTVKYPLPYVERLIYYSVWCGASLYSCYALFLASSEVESHAPNLVSQSYEFMPRRKDESNFEWQFWSDWLSRVWHILLGHVLLGQAIRWFGFQYRRWVFCLYGMFAIYLMLGGPVFTYLLGLCLVAYLAAMTGWVILVWIVSALALTILNFQPFLSWLDMLIAENNTSERFYLMIFMAAMQNIRYTSFCCEWCQNKDSHLSFSLLDMLTYCFYIPTLCTGPIMTYEKFYTEFQAPLRRWTVGKLMDIFTSTLRILLWACVCELSLHYFYFNALMNQYQMLQGIPLWALAGVGYAQGQFFMVKYVVMFGLPRNLARLDQLDPPKGPKCISRIYLYSEMWKYFDRGLYSFIKRHIYIPLGGSRSGMVRQLLASLAAFTFIYYWHGAEDYLFYWVLLNFLGITMETLGSRMETEPFVRRHLLRHLSPACTQRLKAVLAVPILIMSSIAIFMFFGGIDVGWIIFTRLMIQGWPVSTLTVGFVLYSMIQTSADVGRMEKVKKID